MNRGKVADLEKIVDIELLNQFYAMGLIKRGIASINNEPVPTWAATSALEKEYNFFFSPPGNKENRVAAFFKRKAMITC